MSSIFLQQSSGEECVNLLLVAGSERLEGGRALEMVQSPLQRTQFCEFEGSPA